MDRKRYSIYKLTAPSGRSYVGFTGQRVSERWRQHVGRALRGARHPLCAAIRRYGPGSFRVETLAVYSDKDFALEAEVAAIAELVGGYNLSPGGEFDGGTGAARFRDLLADPEWRASYAARLSAALKSSPLYQAKVPELVRNLAEWRAANPAKAYRASLRSLRIGRARTGRRKPPADAPAHLPRKPKGGAAKFHKSKASRGAAVRHWAEMPPDKKAAISSKIARSVKAAHAAKTAEERAAHEAQLAEARKRIDHSVRKARQKAALSTYWTPERRAAFGAEVRARNAAKRREPDADV